MDFTFQYVFINTIGSLTSSAAGLLFTFQYVSINTGYDSNLFIQSFSLHSNMFLLILS